MLGFFVKKNEAQNFLLENQAFFKCLISLTQSTLLTLMKFFVEFKQNQLLIASPIVDSYFKNRHTFVNLRVKFGNFGN